jgi:hypothetical protein
MNISKEKLTFYFISRTLTRKIEKMIFKKIQVKNCPLWMKKIGRTHVKIPKVSVFFPGTKSTLKNWKFI